MPQQDVPTDTVNATEPASPKDLYKNHGRYVSQFVQATKNVAHVEFILWPDAVALIIDAASSDIAK